MIATAIYLCSLKYITCVIMLNYCAVWITAVLNGLILALTFSFPPGFTTAVNVNCPVKRYVVILFQPVTLRCDYSTTAQTPPIITWKYKSFCRDPIQAALNPSSPDNTLAQANPNYNPNIECSDSSRTVRIVASKQTAVTLGEQYQGRKISIINSKRQWLWYSEEFIWSSLNYLFEYTIINFIIMLLSW